MQDKAMQNTPAAATVNAFTKLGCKSTSLVTTTASIQIFQSKEKKAAVEIDSWVQVTNHKVASESQAKA